MVLRPGHDCGQAYFVRVDIDTVLGFCTMALSSGLTSRSVDRL